MGKKGCGLPLLLGAGRQRMRVDPDRPLKQGHHRMASCVWPQ